MKLTDVITQWFEDQGWEERPNIDQENNTSSTGFKYNLGNYSIVCYMDALEDLGLFKLFLYYFDTKVPEQHLDETIKLLTMLNQRASMMGKILYRADEARCIYYANVMDFEGAAFEPRHMSNMLDAGVTIMEDCIPKMLSICFGNKKADDAFAGD